jgi:hypothetical protein
MGTGQAGKKLSRRSDIWRRTMKQRLKKTAIALAASLAIIGAGITVPTTADARGGHWGGHGGGWGWGGFGVGLGTGLLLGAATYPAWGGYYGYGPGYGYGPYAYDYGYGGCTITRRWVLDRHGHRVWRRVRTCY